MLQLEQYVYETLGVRIAVAPIRKEVTGRLPLYVREAYRLYKAGLFGKDLVLVEAKNEDDLSPLQIEKHFQLLRLALGKTLVLVLGSLPSYTRKRLIERGLNFIVPGKQLFIPELLVDLREGNAPDRTRQKTDKLLPSAQFLLIYHIIHKNEKWQLEQYSFKEIAEKLGYTPMAITKAVDNLKYHELVEVKELGEKGKCIKFQLDRRDLWRQAEIQNILVNPVLKKVYVDEKPKVFMLYSNASAMPEYTDLNPVTLQYYALEKTAFYELQNNKELVNLNEQEGNYCLEVWKYDPVTLAGDLSNDLPVVDPLSLYLSMKDNKDERVEMSLDQIIVKYIW